MEEKEYNWSVMNDNDYELHSIISHFNESVNGISDYSAEYEEKEKLYMQAIRVQCQEKFGHIFVLDDFIHMVDEGYFMDYDGCGKSKTFYGETGPYISCSVDELKKIDSTLYPFVAWYNK